MSEEATLDEFTNDEAELLHRKPEGIRLILDESYPKEWKVAELENICEVNSGFTWNKEQETDSAEDGAVPVIKIGNVQDGYLDLTNILYLQGVSDEDLRKNKARKNWLLMIGSNGSGERVGHCGIIEEDMEFVYASFLYGLHGDSEYILPRYLFYLLNRPKVQQRLTSFTAGSTSLKNLNKSTIENLSLPTPPLSEQRKIATVLHNVDQAIQKTEEIVERVLRLKKGVAQDLFHRGHNSSGTKSTWLGEVPKDWEIVQFSEVIQSSRNGVYKGEDAYGSGVPILKMGDMFGDITFSGEDMERLDMNKEEVEKYGLEKGDLLFARRSLNVEGAGECTLIIDLEEPTVFESSLIRVRLNSGVDPMFYAQYFEGPIGSKSIERIVTTTTASGIAGSDLKNLPVPKPTEDIQREVASKLTTYDTRVSILKKEKESLKRLKQGLMDDLLSGTVRTADTNIEVPDEIAQHG